MHDFIPPNIIKEILDQTDIVNIVNERIKIKKIGKNYYAICPFHTENTPSFTINYEKQYFYCFGCNIHGNIIDFLMKYDHMSFIESIHELASITGVNITKKNTNQNQKTYYKKNLYQTNKIVEKLYFHNLQSKYSHEAKIYLKNRKINLSTIKIFNIGFSHNPYFLSKNIKNKNYFDYLIHSGIIVNNKTNHPYDRFYKKIIFPIKNQYGNITGFGGRNLNNNNPKYINSPQSTIFNKSYQLYGIEKVYIESTKQYILVVEGYFDVISLTQFNIQNTVAILGTAITKYQINLLFKLSKHVIFCYDGDKAGKQASYRTMKMMLSYVDNTNNIKFILLPTGEDPNSIIYKEGKKKFQKRIKNAINIINFLFLKLIKNVNFNSIYEITNMLNIAIPLLHRIPSTYIKIHLKKILGRKIGIFDDIQLNKIFKKKKNYIQKNTIKPNNIRILISLIIQNPKLNNILPYTIHELNKIHINGLPLFLEILYICRKYNNINTGQIIELYRNKNTFYIINKLAYWNNLINPNKINSVFINLIKRIYYIALEKKYKKLIIKDRLTNLNYEEKHILWKINKTLSQN
ncbi:DNA primase [Buchnera aphidicola (Takecallis arundicolens)]|uniref:DNA primase n=1 Tax=Buchnera aphidicola TaxID=9 RepID=UPI003463E252